MSITCKANGELLFVTEQRIRSGVVARSAMLKSLQSIRGSTGLLPFSSQALRSWAQTSLQSPPAPSSAEAHDWEANLSNLQVQLDSTLLGAGVSNVHPLQEAELSCEPSCAVIGPAYCPLLLCVSGCCLRM